MTWVAGVDGCRDGWIVVLCGIQSRQCKVEFVERLADIRGLKQDLCQIAVDIPIGLLDSAMKGGRECDRLARQLLGKPRQASVFSAPVRPALKYVCDYKLASGTNRKSSPANIGISKQSHALFPKILEADSLITPHLQEIYFEVHPELCFRKLGGGQPTQFSKHDKEGRGLAERKALLKSTPFGAAMPELESKLPRGVAKDDFLDACAACWTAVQKFDGIATTIPKKPPRDKRNLRMEMWH